MGLTIEKINEVSRNTMAETLKINVIECSKERIVATMPVDARHHQPMGLLHGGASVALAETVASIGGWSHVVKKGKVVVGLEINANHLRQVRSGLVTAIGTPIHLGRTSQVWDIKIYNEEKELVCISRCTLAVIVPR